MAPHSHLRQPVPIIHIVICGGSVAAAGAHAVGIVGVGADKRTGNGSNSWSATAV